MISKTLRFTLLALAGILFAPALGGVGQTKENAGPAIGQVTVSAGSFNPSLNETVKVGYTLSASAQVTVRVYDPDGGLTATLLETSPREAGRHELEWDGRDFEGSVVADEAYTFLVETESGETYDPTSRSGGVVGDITTAQFNAAGGTVVYSLPAPARVLIRLGIQSGPMLKTLVDWKPRVAGSVTEYWDGQDQDGLFRLRDSKGFTALITYVTLPDATVIAYGNSKEAYRDYKLGRGQDRPAKPERPPEPNPERRLRPEGLVPPAWARAPRVRLTFPRIASADVPEVRGQVDVRVDVDRDDKDRLLSDQFEVLFYVDNVFFAEAERGYVPLNWRWELNQIPEGEHILTVNISSFRGQVGVASRKVRVVKPSP